MEVVLTSYSLAQVGTADLVASSLAAAVDTVNIHMVLDTHVQVLVVDTKMQEVMTQSQVLKEELCIRREGSEVVEVVLTSYSNLALQNETIADLLKSLVAHESS